jgi:topoisomerase-4 subunit A
LPNLNKGKGNKLIQLEAKKQILSMTTLNLDEIIQWLRSTTSEIKR